MKRTKSNLAQFARDHIKKCDISYRGGTLKIDVSELYPYIDDPTIGAYQNYLGGGIAGAIIFGAMFEPEDLHAKDQKSFELLKEIVKKLFFEINNGGGDEYMQENYNTYEHNQKLPTSGY